MQGSRFVLACRFPLGEYWTVVDRFLTDKTQAHTKAALTL